MKSARRRLCRGALLLFGAVAIVVLTPAVASAHPLGNFTVNTAAGLRIGADEIAVDYVVDMAEIPTFQARPRVDRNGDDAIGRAEAAAYARRRCQSFASGLELSVDGAVSALGLTASRASLPPGQAGLPTLRVECSYTTPVADAGSHRLRFFDRNLTDRVGWHEVTATGDGARVSRSDVPSRSPSGRLTNYPTDRLQSPPDVRAASLEFRPGGPAAPRPEREPAVRTTAGSVFGDIDDLTQSFTSSVAARDLTIGVALVALAIGVALGAIHAFAPGHGKTVMAAYLVGERGTVRDGLLIGLTVAATHTVGVLALGGALTASQELAPEAVYPYLTLASGVCFVALGATLLWGALRRRTLGIRLLRHSHHHHLHHDHDDHADDHDHGHGHHDHGHGPQDHDHHEPAPARPSRRSLVTLGFAGGLVPTPTAVVVLLGATAIGRAWFGALLVLAYGVGMAATLVAAGVLLARARRRFDLRARSERAMRLAAVIPIATAVVVTVSGLVLVARAATSV
jgi:ABC-type nickel/cobalt efflux system permease component RcnA